MNSYESGYYNNAYVEKRNRGRGQSNSNERPIKSLKNLALEKVTLLEVEEKKSKGYPCSFFELEDKARTMEILSVFLNITNSKIDNVYVHGSRVWGTNKKPNSDWDILVITNETPEISYIECGALGSQFINATVYDADAFRTCLAQQSIDLIPCLFLPPQCILRETTSFKEDYHIDTKVLITDALYQHKRVYLKALKLLNSSDELYLSWSDGPDTMDHFYFAKKCTAHAVRYLLFCIQLLQQHKLYDLTQGYNQWSEIMAINGITQFMQFLQFDFSVMTSPLLATIAGLAKDLEPKDIMLGVKSPLIDLYVEGGSVRGRDERVYPRRQRCGQYFGFSTTRKDVTLQSLCLSKMVKQAWDDYPGGHLADLFDYDTMNSGVRSLIIGYIWRLISERTHRILSFRNPQILEAVTQFGLEEIYMHLSFKCWSGRLMPSELEDKSHGRNATLFKPRWIIEPLPSIERVNFVTKVYKSNLILLVRTLPGEPHIVYFIDSNLVAHQSVLPGIEQYLSRDVFIWGDHIILRLIEGDYYNIITELVYIYKINTDYSLKLVKSIKDVVAAEVCGKLFFIGHYTSETVISVLLADEDMNFREIDIPRAKANTQTKNRLGQHNRGDRSNDSEDEEPERTWYKSSLYIIPVPSLKKVSVEVSGFEGRYVIDVSEPTLSAHHIDKLQIPWDSDIHKQTVTMISPDSGKLETLSVDHVSDMTVLKNKAGKSLLRIPGSHFGQVFGFKNLLSIINSHTMKTFRGTKLIAETGLVDGTRYEMPEGWKYICVVQQENITLYDPIPTLMDMCVQVLRDQTEQSKIEPEPGKGKKERASGFGGLNRGSFGERRSEGWLSDINSPMAMKLPVDLRIRLFTQFLPWGWLHAETLKTLLYNNIPKTIIQMKQGQVAETQDEEEEGNEYGAVITLPGPQDENPAGSGFEKNSAMKIKK